MTTTTSDGGSGTGTGSGGAGSGPPGILRAVGDYTALWIAIFRMTGVLLVDVVAMTYHEVRAQHRLMRSGGAR